MPLGPAASFRRAKGGIFQLPHRPHRAENTRTAGERILPTHGWGKQSVWLAANGSQTLFCGQRPAPTLPARGRSAERKNRPWLQQHISAAYQVLTRNTKKRKFLSEHSLPLRFPPRLPLWAAVCPPSERGRVLPLPAGSGRIWAAVSPLRRSVYSGYPPPPGLFLEDEKKSGIKAGVSGGASGRSHLPALRPQARFGGQPPAVRAALRPEMCGSLRGFAVYQKWGQNPSGAITSAVTIPERLLPQEENRGHTRFRPGFGRKEKTACTSQRAVGTSPARRPGKEKHS